MDASHTSESPGDGLAGRVRRVFASSPKPEERLEQLLAERRRELDEVAAGFEASLAEIERREELLRDSRASVDRMLRLGRADLDRRERELADFERELAERESRLAREEEEIARRRQELGAVELKRASLEQRERSLEARERELDDGRVAAAVPERPARALSVELAFVPGQRYELVTVSLGDVRPRGVVDVAGAEYLVAKVAPSPLPGDRRLCAYLTRGGPAGGPSGEPDGSS